MAPPLQRGASPLVAAAPIVLLSLAATLASVGAASEWYRVTSSATTSTSTVSGFDSYGLLAYAYELCTESTQGPGRARTCTRATTAYVFIGTQLPEFKPLTASAYIVWLGASLLSGAACSLWVATYLRASPLVAAYLRHRCSAATAPALGWLGSLLVLVGLAVAEANFATLFATVLQGLPFKPTLSAGPPLAAVGLALAVFGCALATAAAVFGWGGGAASPFNASPQGAQLQQLQQQQHAPFWQQPFPQPAAFAAGGGAGGAGAMGMMHAPGAGPGVMPVGGALAPVYYVPGPGGGGVVATAPAADPDVVMVTMMPAPVAGSDGGKLAPQGHS